MRRLLLFELIAVLLWLPSCLLAQTHLPADVAQAIEERFKGKVLPLRHLVAADSVKYDEAGNLSGTPKPGDWTLHSKLEVTDAEVKGGTLKIRGNRVGTSFEKWESQKTPTYVRTSDELEIQIKLATSITFSLEQELKKAFLADGEEFPENLPLHWRQFLCKEKAPPLDCVNSTDSSDLRKVGGNVNEPRLRQQKAPSYNTVARAAGLTGQVQLGVRLDKTGRVGRIDIIKPVGLGLDERAIQAVEEWIFDPATEDGVPVPVYLTVIVNFSLRNRL